MRGWVERAGVLVLAAAALGAARPAPQPADPVVALHAGLVRASAASGPSEPSIEALAAGTFDMPAITLAVLGEDGKGATAAERRRLSHVLLRRLARQIALTGGQTADDGFAVVGAQAQEADDWLVTTLDRKPTPRTMVWRVRREGRRFRIVDSLRGGLSTVGVEHDDFAAQLRGRTIETVIAQMEHRAASPAPGL